jgi:hypothetical protein
MVVCLEWQNTENKATVPSLKLTPALILGRIDKNHYNRSKLKVEGSNQVCPE